MVCKIPLLAHALGLKAEQSSRQVKYAHATLGYRVCNLYNSALPRILGCALFSKFLGLNAVLVELDELNSGVPSFLKSDHGKLLRIAIICLVTWVSRGTTCVMVS